MIMPNVFCEQNLGFNGSRICQEPKFSNVVKKDDDYVFTLAVNCVLYGVHGEGKDLVDKYLEEFRSAKSIQVHHEKEVYYKNRQGYELDITEKRKTDHGFMKISSRAYVVAEDHNTLLEFNSYNISADGNSKYTQAEQQILEISKSQTKLGVWSFTITKKVNIRKPMFAPEILFKNETKNGLSKNMEGLARKKVLQLGKLLHQ